MSRTRIIIWSIFGFVVLNVIIGYFVMHHSAQIGAGYLAKQMCSCVYVAGRSFDDCRQDQRNTRFVAVREVPELQGMRSRAYPFPPAHAFYHDGYGCTLE